MVPDVMVPDRYVLVRAASLYGALLLLVGAWWWRRPRDLAAGPPLLAFLWNLPALLAINVLAVRLGWWQFDATGGLLLGIPVDLWLAWATLWGAVPSLAFPAARDGASGGRVTPLPIVAAIAVVADVVLMPYAAPVVRLGSAWLLGEAAGVMGALIPGQLLARWTARGDRMAARATLQVVAFTGLLLFVLPAIVLTQTRSPWRAAFDRPAWQVNLILQLLAVAALIGLTAVQEFAERGGGTPVPFDPPRRLVTTGIYAYVRNPMQLSGAMVLLSLGAVLRSAWLEAAAVMTVVYSAGFARWDEGEDLERRFGEDWVAYRSAVRSWIPAFRPSRSSALPPAELFVSESCTMCGEVASWFRRRGARDLVILPAESHESGALRRITYEPRDGCRPASGAEAVGRALEHIHLGWALIGFLLRLPGVNQATQLLADACGAGPRQIPNDSSVSSARLPCASSAGGREHR